MRIAIFSDIHGNLPALEAVLSDLADQKPAIAWEISSGMRHFRTK